MLTSHPLAHLLRTCYTKLTTREVISRGWTDVMVRTWGARDRQAKAGVLSRPGKSHGPKTWAFSFLQ
jgi:hypothetical protein